jgi:hypothetical protein
LPPTRPRGPRKRAHLTATRAGQVRASREPSGRAPRAADGYGLMQGPARDDGSDGSARVERFTVHSARRRRLDAAFEWGRSVEIGPRRSFSASCRPSVKLVGGHLDQLVGPRRGPRRLQKHRKLVLKRGPLSVQHPLATRFSGFPS